MRMITLSLTLAIVSPAFADQYGVFLGAYDFARDNQDSQYGFSYEPDISLTRLDFKPSFGLLRTRYASHYLFAGFTRRSYVTQNTTSPYLELNFAPGVYFHGGNDDTDLAYWLQFRSGVEIGYQFSDATKIGLAFHHLSNASLAEENPGTETLSVHYRVSW